MTSRRKCWLNHEWALMDTNQEKKEFGFFNAITVCEPSPGPTCTVNRQLLFVSIGVHSWFFTLRASVRDSKTSRKAPDCCRSPSTNRDWLRDKP
jgi:hypothetical protein